MGKIKFHVALFFVALIYAATFSIAKDVMPGYVGSYAFVLMRVGVAGALFWITHYLFIKEKIKDKKDYRDFFICGFFGIAANMTMFFKGLETSLPIHGAVLMLAAPVFVLIFQKLVYKVQIRSLQWLGIFIALIGAFFLIAGKGLQFHTDTWFGDLLILLNAISYAFYIVYVKKMLNKYHFMTVAKWAFFFAFLLVLPIGLNQLTQVSFAEIPSGIWLEIGFVVIATTYFTYFLNAYAIQNTSPAIAGSYIYLQPLLATLIAIKWGADVLTWEKAIFGMLVFLGVYLVNKKKL